MAETPQQPSTCRAGRRRVGQTLMHEICEPHTSVSAPSRNFRHIRSLWEKY
jgi:hypothetical protein